MRGAYKKKKQALVTAISQHRARNTISGELMASKIQRKTLKSTILKRTSSNTSSNKNFS